MWSSTAARVLGKAGELSHYGREASSEPVPLPVSKDSSYHSTHPTQPCLAHRGEGKGRAWGSQGTHRVCVTLLSWHRRDNLQRRFTSFPTSISGTAPSGQQHLLPHSTLQHTPPITHPARAGLMAPLPCSWAQHLPNTPTASNQSMSLLPSWHCSCHTPSLSPRVWSKEQCRAMASHSTQVPGTRRSQKEILDS